jgi:hypothetical protein
MLPYAARYSTCLQGHMLVPVATAWPSCVIAPSLPRAYLHVSIPSQKGGNFSAVLRGSSLERADGCALVYDLAVLALEEGRNENHPPNVTMAQCFPNRTGTYVAWPRVAHQVVGTRSDELKDRIVMRGLFRPPGNVRRLANRPIGDD